MSKLEARDVAPHPLANLMLKGEADQTSVTPNWNADDYDFMKIREGFLHKRGAHPDDEYLERWMTLWPGRIGCVHTCSLCSRVIIPCICAWLLWSVTAIFFL